MAEYYVTPRPINRPVQRLRHGTPRRGSCGEETFVETYEVAVTAEHAIRVRTKIVQRAAKFYVRRMPVVCLHKRRRRQGEMLRHDCRTVSRLVKESHYMEFSRAFGMGARVRVRWCRRTLLRCVKRRA